MEEDPAISDKQLLGELQEYDSEGTDKLDELFNEDKPSNHQVLQITLLIDIQVSADTLVSAALCFVIPNITSFHF